MRYAIIGSGALGGLYGGLLARTGHDVHFLLRSDYEHVRRHGLTIESPWGDFQLDHVQAYRRSEDLPPCDVTIVALKTTANEQVPNLIAGPVGRGAPGGGGAAGGGEGVVMVLQNGLDIEGPAIDVVGRSRVLSGCCFLCSNKVGPGHIRHLDQGRVHFGSLEADGPASDIAGAVAADFAAAGVPIKVVDDVPKLRWRKLMWNIPFNGLSVVLNASTTQLIENAATENLAWRLIEEVHRGAAACGHAIPDEHKAQTIEATRKMVPYDSSMRLDYLAGRPLEIEAIFDHPLDAARRHGHEMPLVGMLRDQLAYLSV